MEPVMSCPQGLTLSGKMCTIAPILSCPTGYTLVNGMCQEDSGVQGFGDAMNMPPSDSVVLVPGELAPPQPQPQPQSQMMQQPETPTAQQPSGNILNQVGQKLVQGLAGDQQPGSVYGQQTMEQIKSVLPLPMRSSNAPQIQSLESPMPMRPISPQRRQQRMMPSPLPQPPPMMSPKPRILPPTASPGPCPAGYSLNRADGMCDLV